MSEVQPAIGALERCIESLAFCHLQAAPRWPAARIVAQQVIDEFIRDAGPDLADRHQALTLLMAEFALRCPDATDPILIRSGMRRQMRRIGYDIKRIDERPQAMETVSEIGAPAIAPAEADGKLETESDRP